MRARGLGISLVAVAVTVSPATFAQEAEEKSADEKPAEKKEGDEKAPEESPAYGHGRQFGLRAGLVGGYRMVFRYDNSPYCHEPDPTKQPKDQQKFCGHGSPFAVELAISFALLD